MGIWFLAGIECLVLLRSEDVELSQSVSGRSLCSKLQVKSPCQSNDMGFKLEQEYYLFSVRLVVGTVDLTNEQLGIKLSTSFNIGELNGGAAVFAINNDPLLQLVALFIEH